MDSIWQPIPSACGRYEASAAGEIRRVGSGRGVVDGRVIQPHVNNSGYLMVGIWSENHGAPRLVHRLVAEAFMGECPIGYEVNHKNSDKLDNRPANLEYVTRSENMLHRSATGVGRGESNGMAKLTEASVREIRSKHRDGKGGYKALAAEYGLNWGTVRDIIKRKTWRWVAE